MVSLVGAGPGDPGLLTLRGRDRIAAADVIVYDRLVHPEILGHAAPGATLIYAGKQRGQAAMSQDEINRALVAHAMGGERVVRLKGGDPFVFGRGGEEATALAAHGISFEIVPGISSGVAAPAYAGIPVTDRRFSSSVAFVTGHERPGREQPDWTGLATSVDTLVIFMGTKHLAAIARALMLGGRAAETPAAAIAWATHDDQRTVIGTLADIATKIRAAGLSAPATVVIGDVVSLSGSLAWFSEVSEEQASDRLERRRLAFRLGVQ